MSSLDRNATHPEIHEIDSRTSAKLFNGVETALHREAVRLQTMHLHAIDGFLFLCLILLRPGFPPPELRSQNGSYRNYTHKKVIFQKKYACMNEYFFLQFTRPTCFRLFHLCTVDMMERVGYMILKAFKQLRKVSKSTATLEMCLLPAVRFSVSKLFHAFQNPLYLYPYFSTYPLFVLCPYMFHILGFFPFQIFTEY